MMPVDLDTSMSMAKPGFVARMRQNWIARGAFEQASSPKSASFLRRAQEIKDKEREKDRDRAQDDSILYNESKGHGTKLRPQRRGESFNIRSTSKGAASSSRPVSWQPVGSSLESDLRRSSLQRKTSASTADNRHRRELRSQRDDYINHNSSETSLHNDVTVDSLNSHGSVQHLPTSKSSPALAQAAGSTSDARADAKMAAAWHGGGASKNSQTLSSLQSPTLPPRGEKRGVPHAYSRDSGLNYATHRGYSDHEKENEPSRMHSMQDVRFMGHRTYGGSGGGGGGAKSRIQVDYIRSYVGAPTTRSPNYENYDTLEMESTRYFKEHSTADHIQSSPNLAQENQATRNKVSTPEPPLVPRRPTPESPKPSRTPPQPPVRDASSLKYNLKASQSHDRFPSWPVHSPTLPQDNRTTTDMDSRIRSWADSSKPDKHNEPHEQHTDTHSVPSAPHKFGETERLTSPKEAEFQSDIMHRAIVAKVANIGYDPNRPFEPKGEFDWKWKNFYNGGQPSYPYPLYDKDGRLKDDKDYTVPSPPERDVPITKQESSRKTFPLETEAVNTSFESGDNLDDLLKQYGHETDTDSNISSLAGHHSPLPPLPKSSPPPLPQTFPPSSTVDSTANDSSQGTHRATYAVVRSPVSKEAPKQANVTYIVRNKPYYNTSTQTQNDEGTQTTATLERSHAQQQKRNAQQRQLKNAEVQVDSEKDLKQESNTVIIARPAVTMEEKSIQARPQSLAAAADSSFDSENSLSNRSDLMHSQGTQSDSSITNRDLHRVAPIVDKMEQEKRIPETISEVSHEGTPQGTPQHKKQMTIDMLHQIHEHSPSQTQMLRKLSQEFYGGPNKLGYGYSQQYAAYQRRSLDKPQNFDNRQSGSISESEEHQRRPFDKAQSYSNRHSSSMSESESYQRRSLDKPRNYEQRHSGGSVSDNEGHQRRSLDAYSKHHDQRLPTETDAHRRRSLDKPDRRQSSGTSGPVRPDKFKPSLPPQPPPDYAEIGPKSPRTKSSAAYFSDPEEQQKDKHKLAYKQGSQSKEKTEGVPESMQNEDEKSRDSDKRSSHPLSKKASLKLAYGIFDEVENYDDRVARRHLGNHGKSYSLSQVSQSRSNIADTKPARRSADPAELARRHPVSPGPESQPSVGQQQKPAEDVKVKAEGGEPPKHFEDSPRSRLKRTTSEQIRPIKERLHKQPQLGEKHKISESREQPEKRHKISDPSKYQYAAPLPSDRSQRSSDPTPEQQRPQHNHKQSMSDPMRDKRLSSDSDVFKGSSGYEFQRPTSARASSSGNIGQALMSFFEKKTGKRMSSSSARSEESSASSDRDRSGPNWGERSPSPQKPFDFNFALKSKASSLPQGMQPPYFTGAQLEDRPWSASQSNMRSHRLGSTGSREEAHAHKRLKSPHENQSGVSREQQRSRSRSPSTNMSPTFEQQSKDTFAGVHRQDKGQTGVGGASQSSVSVEKPEATSPEPCEPSTLIYPSTYDYSSSSSSNSSPTKTTVDFNQRLGSSYKVTVNNAYASDDEEDKPPTLPPRNYKTLDTSSPKHKFRTPPPVAEAQRKESMRHNFEHTPREDAYADQLRQQARKFSQSQSTTKLNAARGYQSKPLPETKASISVSRPVDRPQTAQEARPVTSPINRPTDLGEASTRLSSPAYNKVPSYNSLHSPHRDSMSTQSEHKSEHYDSSRGYHGPTTPKSSESKDRPSTIQISPDLPPPPPMDPYSPNASMEEPPLPPPPDEIIEEPRRQFVLHQQYSSDSYLPNKGRVRQGFGGNYSRSTEDAPKLHHIPVRHEHTSASPHSSGMNPAHSETVVKVATVTSINKSGYGGRQAEWAQPLSPKLGPSGTSPNECRNGHYNVSEPVHTRVDRDITMDYTPKHKRETVEDDTESPSVRDFVANFEKRENSGDRLRQARHLMPRNKVAELKESLLRRSNENLENNKNVINRSTENLSEDTVIQNRKQITPSALNKSLEHREENMTPGREQSVSTSSPIMDYTVPKPPPKRERIIPISTARDRNVPVVPPSREPAVSTVTPHREQYKPASSQQDMVHVSPERDEKPEASSFKIEKPVPAPRKEKTEARSPAHSKPEGAREDTAKDDEPACQSSVHVRQKSQEEIEYEMQAAIVAKRLQDEDKGLSTVILPPPEHKMTTDFMSGIFDTNVDHKWHARTREMNERNSQQSNKESPTSASKSTLPPSSAYWSPPSVANLQNKMRQEGMSPDELLKDMGGANTSLDQQKEELIGRLKKKLEILKQEKEALQEEIKENNNLGKQVTVIVESKCQSKAEVDKYKLYVDELEKVMYLLLKLSGRLARAENAVMGLPPTASSDEKSTLIAKRDELSEKHEDAKCLKEGIDRRSHQVAAYLEQYLTPEEFEDYLHFIKMKSKLTMDGQEIDDKIKLGEEQLAALEKSLAARS